MPQFKFADAPTLTRSMRVCLTELGLEHLWVVTPGHETYRLHEKVTVLPLEGIGVISQMVCR